MKYTPIPDIPFQYMVTDEDYAQAELWVKESKFNGNQYSISTDPNRFLYAAVGEIAFKTMFPFFQKTSHKSYKHDFVLNDICVDVKVRVRSNLDACNGFEYGIEKRIAQNNITHYAFLNYNKATRNVQFIGIISKDNFIKFAHEHDKGRVDLQNKYTTSVPELKMYAEDIMLYCELKQIQKNTNLKQPKPNQTMSNYQKKDGDISVFTNQSANANAPRWKGNLLLNGQEYTVSLWSKNGAKGEFLAGSVQPKQAPAPAPDHFNYPQSNPNSSGDLPF